MAILTYLDASGSGLDPRAKVISVGGFVAHDSDWAEYERRWSDVLAQFGVRELHMRDYAHSRRDFDGWNRDQSKRAAFMEAIGKVIQDCRLEPVGASLVLSVYRLFNKDYCVAEALGTPYTMAAMMAIARSADWRDKHDISEPMRLFVERGDNQQEDFRRHLRRILWQGDSDHIAEPVFFSKKSTDANGAVNYVLPFQACDFIAYEQAKALTDYVVQRKTRARRSILAAVKPIEDYPDGRTYWAVLEQRTFRKAMENFNVPRRYNHFRGWSLARAQQIDPLCYLDGEPMVSYLYESGYLRDEK